MMATTTVAKMATLTRWRLPQWLRWLLSKDVDYHSVYDGYMDKKETTTVAMMATHKMASVLDGYIDKMETTTVA